MLTETLGADLRHMTARWDLPARKVIAWALLISPFYPFLRAMVAVRLSQWAWRHHLRPVAMWLKAHSIRTWGIEVHPAADIGPGFAFVHGVGIVVGPHVVAGRNLVLYQGVTLGDGGDPSKGQPRIGDNVRVGAGAKVLGPCFVGDHAVIGANAVVLADVPPGCTAIGVWNAQSISAETSNARSGTS